MKFTMLGSGTSNGVPLIACECAVCQSADPRNKRNRPCFMVSVDDGRTLVVDTPPEFRLMAIKHRINQLDAVLFTHSHADHIFGLDDVRIYNWKQGKPMPLYGEPHTLQDIKRAFSYCFMETQAGGGKPKLDLVEIEPMQRLDLLGIDILAMRVMHGRLPILAYKFGPRLAYVTDVSHIPEDTWTHLEGLDYLFLDATRREPHTTHFHMEKSLEVVAALKPKQTYLIHLAHDYDYASVNAELPPNVELAYDGLEVTI